MTSKEQPQPQELFRFTEHEKLWDRISDPRFQALLADEATTLHKVEFSSNAYGEFMFVSVSCAADGESRLMTFWGLGYHDYRERWITDQWAWYSANPSPETQKQRITLKEAQELLEQRRAEIAPYLKEDTQTRRGQLFELLADLTDEDGAWAELDDLNDWWDGEGE